VKTREVIIFTGERFEVPQCIQRIDSHTTHGWQVRYVGTKLFSDGSQDGTGAGASLQRATKELLSRIAKLPAPNKLQRKPSANKTSDLPPGVFGPVIRERHRTRLRDCCFSVLVPRFGGTPIRRTVYISTENTFTTERYNQALAKAIEIRQRAERVYQREATKAKRLEAARLSER
jgi:hypothetical protein